MEMPIILWVGVQGMIIKIQHSSWFEQASYRIVICSDSSLSAGVSDQVALIHVLDEFVTYDSELWIYSDVPLEKRKELLQQVSLECVEQYGIL